MTTKRPVDSGRSDSRNRPIKVSAAAAGNQPTAPPPPPSSSNPEAVAARIRTEHDLAWQTVRDHVAANGPISHNEAVKHVLASGTISEATHAVAADFMARCYWTPDRRRGGGDFYDPKTADTISFAQRPTPAEFTVAALPLLTDPALHRRLTG